MKPYTVVICGRPNVGKSSLFNAILRRRVAIVDPTAGVTRDRVDAHVDALGASFRLVDTGGIGLFDEVLLKDEVERQIAIALESADLILLVVDAADGMLPADRDIARRVRALDKDVLVVANKCDGFRAERAAAEFHGLGLGEPIPVSAVERFGVKALIERIVERMPAPVAPGATAPREGADAGAADVAGGATAPGGLDDDGEAEGDRPNRPIRLAIVGKVNSGKSTLMNLLVGEDRVIVSPMAGTTRDAVDAPFTWKDRAFIAIDTAGMRKRRVVDGTPDFYGHARAAESIRRSDVVLFLIDATRAISQIDKAIVKAVAESAKPVVICVTKWDLAQEAGKTPEDYEPYLRQQLHGVDFAPVVFLSALGGFNVDGALAAAVELFEQASYRVGTGELNRLITSAETQRFPRTGRGKFPKVLYATQTRVRPPTFVVFVNDATLFGDEYSRYLSNRLRAAFPFGEVPLRVLFRARHREDD